MIVNVTSRAKFVFAEAPCALALPVFEDSLPVESLLLDEADARTIARWHEKGLVRGKAEEVHFLSSTGRRYEGVLLLGLGRREACTTETLRRAAGQGCAALSAHRLERVVFDAASVPELAHGIVEGILLGQYRFDQYKERKPDAAAAPQVDNITIVLEADAHDVMRHCEQARLACESANWARDLANTPPNDMTPSRLAGAVLEMAEDAGCSGEVYHRDQLEELGMRAFLGVARGSVEPPTLSVLHYTQESATQTIALVGKGITFDTGGISLKPGQDMHEMKFDMCGAAAVAGAFRAIAALRPAINVVCVIPACENAPGGHAQRPGDVVRAYNGKTIEVNNTDAEGRLILADALAYTVDRHRPGLVVDLA
ncbi:MAG TPA: M17 family peptidase N-terminal domain-containing protein, partial [Candidatus Hydrogenedentes bacterium]|nr:M17 family peptidase N-terminal domain-containing protein [Candidatus Hydrogenedentota bacterium]